MTDIVDRLRAPNADFLHEEAADEIERLREALDLIATMRPPIPQDAEGYGPNWDQYIYTRTWAAFASELQRIARKTYPGEPTGLEYRGG